MTTPLPRGFRSAQRAAKAAETARVNRLIRRGIDAQTVCRIANAMRDKRKELIAEPLSKCWERLAMVALEEMTQ